MRRTRSTSSSTASGSCSPTPGNASRTGSERPGPATGGAVRWACACPRLPLLPMINFRFHIVSLIAVFLALGLGILVGSTVIDQKIVNRLDAEIGRVDRE